MATRNPGSRWELPVKIFRTEVAGCDSAKLMHHTAIEISCVVSGAVRLVTERGECNLARGEAFFVSPGEAHSISAIADEALILTLHFEPYYIWELPSGFSDTRLLDIFIGKNRPSANRVPAQLCARITDIMLAAERETKEQKDDYITAIKTCTALILLTLSRAMLHSHRNYASNSREANLVNLRAVMEYLSHNIEKDIDLDSLAQLAGMSKTYFCTVFKRYNGLKPWDYITIKRIDKALWLLSLSADKKASIARDCGFNNSANFYRAFKKITGRTPGDYEKRRTPGDYEKSY